MTHLRSKFTWDLLHEENTGDQNSSSQSGSSICLAAATRVVDCSPPPPSPQYLEVVWECVQWEWLCVKVYVFIIVLTVFFPPRDKTLGTIAECCDVSKTPRPSLTPNILLKREKSIFLLFLGCLLSFRLGNNTRGRWQETRQAARSGSRPSTRSTLWKNTLAT